MGWWQIDPATGKPLDIFSKLSPAPDVVLLNAVPGVDNDSEASFLGDGPWDMASTLPAEMAEAAGDVEWDASELRDLFLERRVPPSLARDPELTAALLAIVTAFWDDIDSCYEDDWDRPANAAEKRWICETAIQEITGMRDVEEEEE